MIAYILFGLATGLALGAFAHVLIAILVIGSAAGLILGLVDLEHSLAFFILSQLGYVGAVGLSALCASLLAGWFDPAR